MYERCIQCPFHGWTFDGATGKGVMGSKLTQKEAIQYEYCDDVGKDDCKEVFKASKLQNVKIKNYLVKEISGYIFIWLHANDEKRLVEPPYMPLDFSDIARNLSHRGFSVNLAKSHIQDIAENGADFLHFLYVHTDIIPYLVKGSWRPNWIKASDPNLRELVKHEKPDVTEHRNKLLDKFLTETNKDHIGVMLLDNYLNICGSKTNVWFFSLIAFQVGPGLVYLFLKGRGFDVIFYQHITTNERYEQAVYHEIYTNNYFPYFVSALYLRLEAGQVENDGVIWDNKKFGIKPFYNPESAVDMKLKEWREWYAKFYEGCKEREEAKDALDW